MKGTRGAICALSVRSRGFARRGRTARAYQRSRSARVCKRRKFNNKAERREVSLCLFCIFVGRARTRTPGLWDTQIHFVKEGRRGWVGGRIPEQLRPRHVAVLLHIVSSVPNRGFPNVPLCATARLRSFLYAAGHTRAQTPRARRCDGAARRVHKDSPLENASRYALYFIEPAYINHFTYVFAGPRLYIRLYEAKT